MTAIDVRNDVVTRIEARLAVANGRRRERLVSLGEVLSCLKDLANDHEYSSATGGSVANAYNYRSYTTWCLAAKVGDRYFVGITCCDAKATTPGRAFAALQPWRNGEGPRGDAAAKWLAWSQSDGVIEIAGMELDAILETESEAA